MTAAEKEYGSALYSLAVDEHLEDELLAGLDTVCNALDAEPRYTRLVQDPALKKEERLSLLDDAFGNAVHPYVLNLAKILCEKSALEVLDGCRKQYGAMLDSTRGILRVTATTAVPLTDAQAAALTAKLSAKTGRTVRLANKVDSGVLGGVRLTYAGHELDGTTAGRLASLRGTLMA